MSFKITNEAINLWKRMATKNEKQSLKYSNFNVRLFWDRLGLKEKEESTSIFPVSFFSPLASQLNYLDLIHIRVKLFFKC